MKVSEAYKLFMAYGRAERCYAKETLGKLRDCFECWIVPFLGEHEVEQIDRADILRMRSAMLDRQLGANRQYSILTTLKLFLKFCRNALKLRCLDPSREIPLPQRPRPNVQYLTNEEVRQMLSVIKPHTFCGLRLRTLIEVLLSTGMRISEALSLNRESFERAQREVQITGKGGKVRTVFFSESCLDWIHRFLYYRRADDHPALFVTTGIPRRLQRSDMSKAFKKLRAEAGIDKPLTPHLLRHTFCTNLLMNGADITFIKELAGHSDIQTTAKYYLGVDKRALATAVRKYLNYGSESAPI